jgi:hypothetical protein
LGGATRGRGATAARLGGIAPTTAFVAAGTGAGAAIGFAAGFGASFAAGKGAGAGFAACGAGLATGGASFATCGAGFAAGGGGAGPSMSSHPSSMSEKSVGGFGSAKVRRRMDPKGPGAQGYFAHSGLNFLMPLSSMK